jgi:hypothetical protein
MRAINVCELRDGQGFNCRETWGKADVPYSDTTRIWTPKFEWYFLRCGSKIRHQKDTMCWKFEIGLRAQNMQTHPRTNSQHDWGDLYDHLMSTTSSSLRRIVNDKIFIIWAPKTMSRAIGYVHDRDLLIIIWHWSRIHYISYESKMYKEKNAPKWHTKSTSTWTDHENLGDDVVWWVCKKCGKICDEM